VQPRVCFFVEPEFMAEDVNVIVGGYVSYHSTGGAV
jgi:hypothetical protein